MNWLQIAKTLINNYPCLREARWAIPTLAVYVRDGGKCVYCGFNLLTSQWVLHGCAKRDHLLPKREYPQLEHELSNWVLCCCCCNEAKGTWNPNAVVNIYKGEAQLSDEQRNALVAVVKERLLVLNRDREERFAKEREAISKAVEETRVLTATK